MLDREGRQDKSYHNQPWPWPISESRSARQKGPPQPKAEPQRTPSSEPLRPTAWGEEGAVALKPEMCGSAPSQPGQLVGAGEGVQAEGPVTCFT